jgi:hypothetical protein
MLRGFGGSGKPVNFGAAAVDGSAFRFSLPPGAAPADMYLAIPAYIAAVEVWMDGTWVLVDDRSPDIDPNVGGDPTRIRRVDLPRGAVADGRLFTRVSMRPELGVFDGTGFELREGLA